MRLTRVLCEIAKPKTPFQQWLYQGAGHQKYGLLSDDLYRETPAVKEALRRIPEELQMERIYRIKRAQQLTLMHQILPKEEWVKEEEDVLYLRPVLKEVMAEIKEKEEWGKN